MSKSVFHLSRFHYAKGTIKCRARTPRNTCATGPKNGATSLAPGVGTVAADPGSANFFPDDSVDIVRTITSEYGRRYFICDTDSESPLPDCSSVFTHAPSKIVSRGVTIDLGQVVFGEVRYNRHFALWEVKFQDDESAQPMTVEQVTSMSARQVMDAFNVVV